MASIGASPVAPGKRMTLGEGGSVFALAALALLSIVVAAKAWEAAYAFHAWLFAAGSIVAVFAIFNRYNDRPATLPPQEIDGKPNYNMGPVKFATVAAMVWGIAGFTVGVLIAFQLAYPALNFDIAWLNFGRMRPLHTSAVIFAFGGNVLIATSLYVVQRTSRARLFPSWPALCSGATSCSSCWRRRAICSASPRAANMPSPNGMWICG